MEDERDDEEIDRLIEAQARGEQVPDEEPRRGDEEEKALLEERRSKGIIWGL